ncbi:hypothetical protein WJX72_010460 [[Myrmecia] bisecta]|uniref:Vacuolar protein sorting-associated protein 29 n=1 Tax=[Myrmecia] bisecta TaxID=41462 RepID=A0AAW1PA23_9CHLO
MLSRIGLVSDTHGVFDQALEAAFEGVDLIIHAGDVGHHGGHEAVLDALQSIAPTEAVRGNVDNGACLTALPESRLVTHQGWRILIVHIVGSPPAKVDKAAAALVEAHQPDIVVFGHSHKFSVTQDAKVLYINPGSAGPARFKLPRTAAVLTLPAKVRCCGLLLTRPRGADADGV